MNLDDVLNTFLAESDEMLAEMERLLLLFEQEPLARSDAEQLNSLFRCIHTIKGSAGIFGFDAVVAFTHVVENLLDRLRGGEVAFGERLAGALLACRDHIAALIALRTAAPDAALATAGDALLAALAECAGGSPVAAGQSDATLMETSAAEPVAGCWQVQVRFGRELLRQGMDPLGFIRFLATLGEIRTVSTLLDALPAPADFDPECCYLGFDIALATTADKAAIENVFEFVRDDCELRISPPSTAVDSFVARIEALPDEPRRVGEMLVASGALTPAELASGLRQQQARTDEAPLGFLLVAEGVVDPQVVSAALDKQKQVRATRPQSSQYIRVQADKLDALINLVGELVIASAAARLSAQRGGDSATQEAVLAVSTLVESIRDGSLELRMVPIGETFQRFQRVVRDVSHELGKDIRLEIRGADTELDKTVVEKIADPLTHLVRNAIDHGIESAECRAQLGKPVEGTVRLNAFHEAGSVVIEVSDDGGGLRRDRILAKAVDRGLIQSADEVAPGDVFNLIFEPGFSTADTVTNISGRGVGMDVVRRSIEALRGTVEIDSVEGRGTTLRIRLPLTLAIIDGFLVEVGEASYVVPLDRVIECVELTAIQQRELVRRNVVNLRDEPLPVVRLRDAFDVDGSSTRRENIVVVNYGGRKAGLVVDTLLGEHQTVIKPLGQLFSNLIGISGSTILGSGEVALILDVPTLVQQAMRSDG
jgi:two-component system chemotaxis sensor kinase CheA